MVPETGTFFLNCIAWSVIRSIEETYSKCIIYNSGTTLSNFSFEVYNKILTCNFGKTTTVVEIDKVVWGGQLEFQFKVIQYYME